MVIWNETLRQIQEVCFFSVIADEATDVANDEQLSISIHFLEDTVPSEKFLDFN